jgi:hypothetical protein
VTPVTVYLVYVHDRDGSSLAYVADSKDHAVALAEGEARGRLIDTAVYCWETGSKPVHGLDLRDNLVAAFDYAELVYARVTIEMDECGTSHAGYAADTPVRTRTDVNYWCDLEGNNGLLFGSMFGQTVSDWVEKAIRNGHVTGTTVLQQHPWSPLTVVRYTMGPKPAPATNKE